MIFEDSFVNHLSVKLISSIKIIIIYYLLTAAKNAIVGWLLNFRIRMFVKSAVKIREKTLSQISYS